MIAGIVRHFGSNPDYWEDALTGPRLQAYRENLKLEPPAEWFLAGYFKYLPQGDAPASIEPPPSQLPDIEE